MYEQYLPTLLTLLAILIAWFLLRHLLRLTRRIFSCGCMAVFGLGILYLAVRYIGVV